jgi:hypothetical protein
MCPDHFSHAFLTISLYHVFSAAGARCKDSWMTTTGGGSGVVRDRRDVDGLGSSRGARSQIRAIHLDQTEPHLLRQAPAQPKTAFRRRSHRRTDRKRDKLHRLRAPERRRPLLEFTEAGDLSSDIPDPAYAWPQNPQPRRAIGRPLAGSLAVALVSLLG